jgi:hypothetical protein
VAELSDARLLDIVRHGAGAPELKVECCDDVDLEVNRDSDDRTVFEIVCRSCRRTVAYVASVVGTNG